MDMSGTKWDIFLAALDLFARVGYHNVSVAQIANAAGIRASSIYNHFPCKDALVETMYQYYDECSARHLPSLDLLVEQVPDRAPADILQQIIPALDPRTRQIMEEIFLVAAGMQSDVRAKLLIQRNVFQTPQRYLSRLLGCMMDRHIIEPLDIDDFIFVYCSVCHSVGMRCGTPGAGPDWPTTAARLLDQYIIPCKSSRAAGA